MNGVSGHDSALQGFTRLGTTWANEMNVGMNYAPDAGSLPLCHGCPMPHQRLYCPCLSDISCKLVPEYILLVNVYFSCIYSDILVFGCNR